TSWPVPREYPRACRPARQAERRPAEQAQKMPPLHHAPKGPRRLPPPTASSTLPQSRQHFQAAIAVGGHEPSLDLEILDGLHRVVADPAIGAAGIEACLGQARLHLLHLAERQRTLRARERLDEWRAAEDAVAEMNDRKRVVHRRVVALH